MEHKQKNIFFSIIICCYNSEKYLKETIESVINQKYKFWEIILVNDGSNDSTEKITLDFKNSGFPIIYHKNTKNLGFAKARNIAHSHLGLLSADAYNVYELLQNNMSMRIVKIEDFAEHSHFILLKLCKYLNIDYLVYNNVFGLYYHL